MHYPRGLVLTGCVSALIVMTILSATVGWAAPNLISRKWIHHIKTLLFFGFGLWSMWDSFKQGGVGSGELAEVEAELDFDLKANSKATKDNSKVEDENKKQTRPFLTQFFSPIFLKAFSINFFGEFGDKIQLEEALSIDPKKHNELWCVGNAHTSYASQYFQRLFLAIKCKTKYRLCSEAMVMKL